MTAPPSADEMAVIVEKMRAHGPAMQRLIANVSRRWVLGTGWVHFSVVRDAVAMGIVEARPWGYRTGIRANALTPLIRTHLIGETK